MSQSKHEKKALQKRLLKEKERKARASGKGDLVKQPGKLIATHGVGADFPLITHNQSEKTVTINIHKLVPPTKQFNPNCFAMEVCFGYSDLFFGLRNPRDKSADLLKCLIVRIPNLIIKDIIIKQHKNFYNGLQKSNPVNDKHEDHFSLLLGEQFPISEGSHHFTVSNFIIGAHGSGDGELMFFKISPAYLHHVISGAPTIVDSEDGAIDGIVTVNLPIELLSYVYKKIIEKKDEF